ncbi:MAG: adenylosuccinate synthase [Acidobacteria bacterium]|nr:adenylosuccinate synthase [Acidobacteriota bacterium]
MGDQKSMMVIGGQWGDEGKGKVVDLLSGSFLAVVRYNGGHNAGHTVRVGERKFALHLVPSGIIHPQTRCYMGAGLVIDPTALLTEIDRLSDEGIEVEGRLCLSPRAAIILPTHRALDLAREDRRGEGKIGTTGRGIGPAYQDIAQRRCLRTWMLATPAKLRDAARDLMLRHNAELVALFGAEEVDVDEALAEVMAAAKRLAPLLREVGPEIRRHVDGGDPILFEGAQGVLLDINWGTYPFVTSSSCLPGFAAASCGVGPGYLGPVLGVMKAYATRVGSGPFPTEDFGPDGDGLRDRGAEYGTTTGRPRRCGWFDVVAARHAIQTAGIDALALTKIDVLDGLKTLKVCVAYEGPGGELVETVPADAELLAEITPRYVDIPGWDGATEGMVSEETLPEGARAYLDFLEDQVGVPVALVSTGPRRDETMARGSSAMARRIAKILSGA